MRTLLFLSSIFLSLSTFAQPSLSAFTPTSAGAGSTITITGGNLTGVTSISLGGTSVASFSVLSSTTVIAVVGSGSTGSLSVTTAGGTAALTGFTFIPSPPTLSSFTPTSAGAGATITITGGNLSGVTSISLGGTSVASFSVLSSTTVIAVVGNGSTGSLSVTTAGGTAALTGFTFIPSAPTLSSFTPTSAGAGATITITGGNLSGATSISLGGTSVGSFRVLSSTTVTAVVGNGSTGSLSVTTAGGTVALTGFTFIPSAPTLSSFTPTSAGAGATITITGGNLSGATSISLGGTSVGSFRVLSSTTVTAVVGNGSTGSLSVTTSGGTAALTGFTFIPPSPTLSSFAPSSAGLGATITITGENLSGATSISFGGASVASFRVLSSTTITAVVGNGSTGSLSVTTAGGTAALTGFTFISPASNIISFTPSFGNIGSTVTINGNNFNTKADSNIVFFGAVKALVKTATNNVLSVIVPAGANYQPISVTANGITTYAASPFDVTFRNNDTTFKANMFSPGAGGKGFILNYQVLAQDIDGDGKPDLVGTDGNNNMLSILLNQGAGKFGNKTDFPFSNTPQKLINADLDGDGKQDIIILQNNFDGKPATIAVFKNTTTNTGSVSFSPMQEFQVGLNSVSLMAGDVNGDGKPDLVLGCSDTISVFRNTSTQGSFSLAQRIDFKTGRTDVFSNKLALGDLDGDGRIELIAGNNSGQISIYRSTSEGGFAFNTNYNFQTVNAPSYPVVCDIDGDGKNDIVVVSTVSDQLSILRNTTVSNVFSFAEKVSYQTNRLPVGVSIKINDFDGDSKPDILVGYDSLSLFRNTSTPGVISFNKRIVYPLGQSLGGLDVCDIDADGKPDLLISAATSISVWRNRISEPVIASVLPVESVKTGDTLLVKGNNFTGVTNVLIGGTSPTSFSVENDSTIKAIVGTIQNSNGFIKVSSSFGSDSLYAFRYNIPSIDSISPLKGAIGSSVFIYGKNFSTAPADNIVYFGGVKAKIISTSTNKLSVIIPEAAGYNPISITTNGLTAYSTKPFNVTFKGADTITATTFGQKIVYATGAYAYNAASADFDGDGKLDYVVANYSDKSISVALNTSSNGKISFSDKVDFTTSGSPSGIAVGDINGDGKIDIIVSNELTKTVSIFRNTSTGSGVISFASKIDFAVGKYPGGIALADLNKDGRLDVIVTNNQDGTVSVLKNTSTVSNINFAESISLTAGNSPHGIAIADVNTDGLPDICVSNQYSNTVSVFQNKSTGSDISFLDVRAYATGVQPYNLAIADFDGDGSPDIITANLGSNDISILRNTSGTSGVTSFTTKVDIPVSVSPNNISSSDINGDGKPDIAISSSDVAVMVMINKSSVNNIAFSNKTAFSVQQSSSCILLNDYDNDGKPDLGVGFGSYMAFFRNQISFPILTSFSPTSAKQGDTITIKGKELGLLSEVRFGGVPAASFNIVSDTLIKAIVGFGTSGKVKIIASNGSADSAEGFIFNAIPAPKILSLSPASGQIGSSIIISGNNFSSVLSENIVYFGAVKASVTAATVNSLTVTVPVAGSYLPVSVTVNGLSGYSPLPFNISFSGSNSDLARTNLFVRQSGDFTINKLFIKDLFSQDLDGDGKVDVVAIIQDSTGGGYTNSPYTFNSGALLIARNTSTINKPAFSEQKIISTGLSPSEVSFADIDGDGKVDIITSNHGDNTISILRNNSSPGSISFEPPKNYPVVTNFLILSGHPNSVAIGDLNNDGKPDIVTSVGNTNQFSIFPNTSTIGSISFASRIDIGNGFGVNSVASPTSITLTDLNKDGKMDIALSNAGNGFISVFRNTTVNGLITYSNKQDIPMSSYRIASADIDGDGLPEIVGGDNLTYSLHILRNTSKTDSIYFANMIDINSGTQSTYFVVNNFDGDGKADIVIGNPYNDSLVFLKNQSSQGLISFAKSVSKTNLPESAFVFKIATADFDGDGLQDLVSTSNRHGSPYGSDNFFSIDVILNRLSAGPKIISFTPQSGGTGTTVTIKGTRFSGTTAIYFGRDTANNFTVNSDSVITAKVRFGATGFVKVVTANGSDSLAGFVFKVPEINLLDTAKSKIDFTAIKGSYSSVNSFSINGKQLQAAVTITAPASFQVSKYADSGFASLISINPVNNLLDSTRLYVRFKNDTATSIIQGSILIESVNANTKTISVTGKNCDSTIFITPKINSILNDSIFCFKDSLTLIPSSGNYNIYKWSSGDSSNSIVIKNSANITLQVGVIQGCLSNPSSNIRFVKNTNPIPSLALLGDNSLLSSSAPNYRWYINNTLVSGNTSNKIVPSKVGFYSVETSNDKVCWDRSTDYPIISITTPLINDSVSVKTYPNPTATGIFYIVATLHRPTNVVAKVTVTDVNGVVLLQTNKFIFFGREIKIPITLSVKGTVFAKIDINGDIKTQTVILQ